jgi:hypothetical protein
MIEIEWIQNSVALLGIACARRLDPGSLGRRKGQPKNILNKDASRFVVKHHGSKKIKSPWTFVLYNV